MSQQFAPIKSSIIINTSAATVWDALVNPAQTKRYMFGCETVSDWQVGSPLIWQMEYEGKPFVPVKGKIVRMEPNVLLAYTVIDPNSATVPDLPENYLDIIYELEETDGQTLLTVTMDGFEGAADAEKRYKDSYNDGEGWNPILVQIKAVCES